MTIRSETGTRQSSGLQSAVAWARALGVPVAIAVFIVGFQLNIADMELESRAYPQLVMAVLGVAAIVTAVEGVKERLTAAHGGAAEPLPEPATWAPVVATLGVTAVYIFFAIPALGFYAATAVYLGGLARLLGLRSWVAAIVFALALTVVCYVVFTAFFSVPLPRGVIP